jgi:hypothetical protein
MSVKVNESAKSRKRPGIQVMEALDARTENTSLKVKGERFSGRICVEQCKNRRLKKKSVKEALPLHFPK